MHLVFSRSRDKSCRKKGSEIGPFAEQSPPRGLPGGPSNTLRQGLQPRGAHTPHFGGLIIGEFRISPQAPGSPLRSHNHGDNRASHHRLGSTARLPGV